MWRELLERSARAEERYLLTHDEKYLDLAMRYLQQAKGIYTFDTH